MVTLSPPKVLMSGKSMIYLIKFFAASIQGICSNSNFFDENLGFSNFPLRTKQALNN